MMQMIHLLLTFMAGKTIYLTIAVWNENELYVSESASYKNQWVSLFIKNFIYKYKN